MACLAVLAALFLGVTGLAPAAWARPDGADEIALERAKIPLCPPAEVRVRSGESKSLRLGCDGLNAARARIVKAPRHGRLGKVDQARDRVRFHADAGYSGRSHVLVSRRLGGRVWRAAVLIDIRGEKPRRARSRCTDERAIARYRGAVSIRVVCRGRGLKRLRVLSGPRSGELDEVVRSSRRAGSGRTARRVLEATYDPVPRFAGQETILIGAQSRGSSDYGVALIPVLPWRMRALGDSVTAGFGFYGDPLHNGFEMSTSELLDCKPGAVVSNRCSSNSDERGGYTGPPEWSTDFGLANNVSWAAQFANGIQDPGTVTAPDMFQNRAVTGSAPSDWLPGGILNDELEAIVAEDPELIAMTMGANPLLTDLLLTEAGEECSETDTAAALESCLAPFFEQVQLTERLQQLYSILLGTQHSTIVVFQYHLAVPAANLFDTWQLEVMIDFFNEQISTAVANTKAAVSASQAARLVMIPAQVDPNAPAPGLLPRFNVGLPPDGQTWSAGYDCGDDDFVDGPSHQSEPTQDEFETEHPFEYCEGDEWIIGSDSGIHPDRDGYAQFAQTLAAVSEANSLVPRLP